MFIRAKYVLQFSRCDDLQNTGFDPAIENRRIVWVCILKLGEARWKKAFHTITDFPLLHILNVSVSKNQAKSEISGKNVKLQICSNSGY